MANPNNQAHTQGNLLNYAFDRSPGVSADKPRMHATGQVYWARQVLTVLVGLLFGVLKFQGFLALPAFVLVNQAALLIVVRALKIECKTPTGEEDQWAILGEGFLDSFFLFMVRLQ